MKIATVPLESWVNAIVHHHHEPIVIPFRSRIPASLYGADLKTRLAVGHETQSLLQGQQSAFLLDSGMAALSFVEGPGGLADLKLTHETLGLPLVSCCVDQLPTVLGALPWPIAWDVLASRKWIKFFSDQHHVEELHAFGIPQVFTLPPCAPEHNYELKPLQLGAEETLVSFCGNACPTPIEPKVPKKTLEVWNAYVNAFPHVDSGIRFLDIYNGTTDRNAFFRSDALQSERTQHFFKSKQWFTLTLARKRRDALVISLANKFGKNFGLRGEDWTNMSTLQNSASDSFEDYLLGFRQSAININFIEGDTESSLNLRHFEIMAAGGFMLCQDHPEVHRCFEVGKECITFRDEQEMFAKIDYYLAHREERQAVAQAGQTRTLNEHLYRHRLLRILSAVDAIRTVMPDPTKSARPPQPHVPRDEVSSCAPHIQSAPDRLLVLLNPGRCTRICLSSMAISASRLGIEPIVLELEKVWALANQGRDTGSRDLAQLLKTKNVRGVLSYTLQGCWEWPAVKLQNGRLATFFEQHEVPHVMWWTDHPQWANECEGLRLELQPLLRSANQHHVVKSPAAAEEIRSMLGWENARALPVAEDPDILRPHSNIKPEYDVVAIVASVPRLPPELIPFLDSKNPCVEEMMRAVASRVRTSLRELWLDEAPQRLQGGLIELGERWVEQRCGNHLAIVRVIFNEVVREFPQELQWLRENFPTYFRAVRAVWDLTNWQRTFYLAYLARHVRVGIFGADWRSVGLEGSPWVDYEDQARVYAQGKMAINIAQANDDQGLSHKPFQIAASGAPMLHIERPGLEDCFTPGVEVEVFRTPAEALTLVRSLMDDETRRKDLGEAGRARMVRSHTWDKRLPDILAPIRINHIRDAQSRSPVSILRATVGSVHLHAPAGLACLNS